MAFPETNRKSTVREYYEALLIAMIFVNFAKIFVFQAFKIPSGSMMDNLLIGDHIIVNKYVYGAGGAGMYPFLGFREIEKGDIIVFRFPGDPTTDFVKRVVALPGETVSIRDKAVFIDGRKLPEPYKIQVDETTYPPQPALPEPYRSRDQFGPFRVPDGQYFVMGDNRDRSNDSRFWGTVPRSMIKGRAFLVYWSYRGVPPPPGSQGSDRVKELLRVIGHFRSLTRWNRTFFVIDSRYHYGAEGELERPAEAPTRRPRWQQ
jgi:signal peptidase I